MQRTCNWIKKATGGIFHGNIIDKYLIIQGVSTDTRKIQVNQLYVPLVGEQFNGHHFLNQAIHNGAAAVLWQNDHDLPEDIKVPIIVVPNTLLALQQMAAVYRKELSLKVIGVTGSNGKTTTKDLIAAVLSTKHKIYKTQGNLNNHIGVPLTLLSIPESTEVAVIEMGMNHAGEIKALSSFVEPDIVVITNIGESHIEYLGSREGITEAKLEIKEGLKENGVIVYDGDEPLLRDRLKNDTHKHIRVGWGPQSDLIPYNVNRKGLEGFTFEVKQFGDTTFLLPLLGEHNVKNTLFALAIADTFGVSNKEIQAGLSQVQLTGMRLEINLAQNGMKLINDTYNSSPTSARSAVQTLLKFELDNMEKWVLLGDMNELGTEEECYHRQLGEYIAGESISRIYTIGNRGKWIGEEVQKRNECSGRIIHHFSSVSSAAEKLIKEGRHNVLLLIKSSRALRLDKLVHYLIKGRVE